MISMQGTQNSVPDNWRDCPVCSGGGSAEAWSLQQQRVRSALNYSFERLFGECSGMKSEKNDILSTKTGTLFREDSMTVGLIPVTALWFLRAQDCTSSYIFHNYSGQQMRRF
ncbi:Adenylate Cyclase Type 10 [Manis pentadactyla]|nr:Adenylate Cyclase Type 10 [Manis pentadactyla]